MKKKSSKALLDPSPAAEAEWQTMRAKAVEGRGDKVDQKMEKVRQDFAEAHELGIDGVTYKLAIDEEIVASLAHIVKRLHSRILDLEQQVAKL